MVRELESKVRRPLVKLLQFKVRRETDYLRDDLLKSVIEAGLFLYSAGKEKWASLRDIAEVLCKEYKTCELPPKMMKKYLNELNVSKRVTIKNGTYLLSKERTNEISKTIKTRKSLQDTVLAKLTASVEEKYGKLSEKQKKLSKDNFLLFLSKYVTMKGYISTRFLSFVKEESILPLEQISTVLNDTIGEIRDSKLRRAQKDAIIGLCSEKAMIDFFYLTLQNYICFEVLSIDPECQALTREILSNRKVFLDTNVVLDVLLPEEPRHDLTKMLVQIARQLGVEMRVTLQTRYEFNFHLSKTKKAHKVMRSRVSEKAIEKMSKYGIGLLKSYYKEKKSNPALTFDGYFLMLSQTFKKGLKEQFGIELDDNPYEEINKHSEFPHFYELVERCAFIYSQFKERKVVGHDAFHLLLIKELRSKDESSNPLDYWFVTQDHSLHCVSRNLMEEGKLLSPLSVEGHVFLDVLTLFLPLSIIEETTSEISETFMKFCSSTLTYVFPSLSVSQMVMLATPWIDYDRFTADDLMDIISYKIIQDYITEPQIVPVEKIEPIPEDKIKPVVAKKIDRKLEKLEERVESLEKDKVKVERQTSYLPLFVIGIISFLLIPILGFVSSWAGFTVSETVYESLRWIAIVLILVSVFGRRVFKRISI